MLVLTRKTGESIEMDGPGKITVLEIDRGAVKIGMEASPEVRILRSELRQQEAARGRSQDAIPPCDGPVRAMHEAPAGALQDGSLAEPRQPKQGLLEAAEEKLRREEADLIARAVDAGRRSPEKLRREEADEVDRITPGPRPDEQLVLP